MIKIKLLNKKEFEKYGTIIEPQDKNKIFDVICKEEEKVGWRIGYLVMSPQEVSTIEAHPNSQETFEPVKGTSVIIVAEPHKPQNIEAFLLDKPVCLKKGVWHGILVLSETAEIKITENFEVESIYYNLEKPLNIYIGILER